MRKLKITFIIISIISLFFACNSDDNSNKNVQASIVKKWFIEKWIYNNVNQTLTDCDKQGYIQFNSNGTFERKRY